MTGVWFSSTLGSQYWLVLIESSSGIIYSILEWFGIEIRDFFTLRGSWSWRWGLSTIGSRSFSILLSYSASLSSTFLTGSPSSRVSIDYFFSWDEIVIISIATCMKKSFRVKVRNEIWLGINSIVSQWYISLVRGK